MCLTSPDKRRSTKYQVRRATVRWLSVFPCTQAIVITCLYVLRGHTTAMQVMLDEDVVVDKKTSKGLGLRQYTATSALH